MTPQRSQPNGSHLEPATMPEFNCNSCGARLRIDTAMPGQSVRCGHCGQPTVIPIPEGAPPPLPEISPHAYTPPTTPAYNNNPAGNGDGLAIAALVCGIIGIIGCPLVGILGLVFGTMARKQNTNTPGMALAGIIMGIISAFFTALFFIVIIVILATA